VTNPNHSAVATRAAEPPFNPQRRLPVIAGGR
jgi:hypothetical protein